MNFSLGTPRLILIYIIVYNFKYYMDIGRVISLL